MTSVQLSPARPDDATACAAILNNWIDATPWMPRVHPHDDVERHYREVVLATRAVTVARDGTIVGFLALDTTTGTITALYCARTGEGIGRRLLASAKSGRGRLDLWTFEANGGARRFYAREGFVETRTTSGENEEGLPDILMAWERTA